MAGEVDERGRRGRGEEEEEKEQEGSGSACCPSAMCSTGSSDLGCRRREDHGDLSC